jgi:putative redox protein
MTGSDVRTVTVHGNAAGFAQTISVAQHRLTADEPVSVGGTDTGPNPYDLLLAALGACTSMTLAMYARRKEWPLEAVTVRLRHSRVHAADCEACETRVGLLDHVDRELEFSGPLSDEQRARLLDIANKCPVHRTLASEIVVQTRMAGGSAA